MDAPAPRPAVGIDVLFVGVTRPALRFGVPYAALLVNALVTLELFLVTRNLLSLVAAVPIHALVWMLTASEPRFFELLKVWAMVRARAAGGRATPWSTLAYGPFGHTGGADAMTLPLTAEAASC
jgi:type IV secretion system protein VirB3